MITITATDPPKVTARHRKLVPGDVVICTFPVSGRQIPGIIRDVRWDMVAYVTVKNDLVGRYELQFSLDCIELVGTL